MDRLRDKAYWKKTLRAIAPPFALVGVLSLFFEPLKDFLGVSWFVMPLISLVVLAPWFFLGACKTWREAKQERQALEKKYEAEDRLLFGQPRVM